YWEKDQSNRIKQQSIDLSKFVTQKINKLYKKLQKLQEELMEAEESQKYRIYGELLTAHLHLIQPGDQEIEVINYYSDNEEKITIPLVPTWSPAKNAQNYFKKYTKAKNALKEKKIQLEETERETQYFENLLHAIENVSTLQDIEEIRDELIEEGYLKKRKNKVSNKKKAAATKPMSFISSDGFQIFVGKNNRQNDLLTLKLASKKDLWFHAKNIPGSHVVIVSNQRPIPQRTILEAGELAAFYSKAKLSSNVPVDYTEIKNVKKPNGAKPGMVIYENYKTIFVTPRPNIGEILSKHTDRSK
ncbi:MAG TPA: fibronectin-binding domain-containing protein, partial [Clostridiales bacterium]|nr:fibronectin-binding domain-containing protein [Clostridiales bacterium]